MTLDVSKRLLTHFPKDREFLGLGRKYFPLSNLLVLLVLLLQYVPGFNHFGEMSEKNGKKAAMKASKKKIKQLRKPKLVQTKAKEQSAKVGAKRKRAAEDSDDDDDNSDDEDKDEDELDLQVKDGEVVQEGAYTFEFSDVRDAFYGGIQLMLTKQVYSTGTAHDFAEIICKQGRCFLYPKMDMSQINSTSFLSML